MARGAVGRFFTATNTLRTTCDLGLAEGARAQATVGVHGATDDAAAVEADSILTGRGSHAVIAVLAAGVAVIAQFAVGALGARFTTRQTTHGRG